MRRNKILIVYCLAALLGVITGFIGSLFQMAIDGLSSGLAKLMAYTGEHGWPKDILSALVSMFMVFTAWLMVKYIAPEAAGSGVQEIEGVLLNTRRIFWRRLLPVKFFGGVLAISSNLVVGREGPTIQMGGNLGEMIGEWSGLSRHRRDALVAAGAAAGLATAFNAPLAGVLFVLEEMRTQFRFTFTNFSIVAVCCVFAIMVLHRILGSEPAIPMSVFNLPDLSSVWLFFIFGIMAGFVGLLFNITLMKSLYALDKLSPSMRHVYVLLVGLAVGYFAYTHPDIVGGGYGIIHQSLTMNPTFSVLVIVLVIRFIATMLCYNTGVPGGIFAPMLALGTLLGVTASHIFQWLAPTIAVDPGMFAVAGMGALFAAIVRAPITGIILVVEMTNNYMLIYPLMVTCLMSTLVVQLAGNPPIYAQLLRRTLKKS